jgi:hypothetical protein
MADGWPSLSAANKAEVGSGADAGRMQGGCMTPMKGVDCLSDGGLSHVSSAAPMSRRLTGGNCDDGSLVGRHLPRRRSGAFCRPTTLPIDSGALQLNVRLSWAAEGEKWETERNGNAGRWGVPLKGSRSECGAPCRAAVQECAR